MSFSLSRTTRLCSLTALLLLLAGLAEPAAARPIGVDDVLATVALDRVAVSPDGAWIAAVVQRPATNGEVFGRTAYETDPSRSDVWLISRATGEARNLTRGADRAAGFWCAAWSPDGSRLAMLSTRPEGGEPRGGDNVRLYVWEKANRSLRRLGAKAVVTQTRYGSPLYRLDLRGGADRGTVAHACGGDENAPFLWLDNRRLLALRLPPGGVSGLIDQYSRPSRHTAATAAALREGKEPTFTASGSGAARLPEGQRIEAADLDLVDAASGAAGTVARLPLYPFRGELTVSVAPGGTVAAILATTGTIPPSPGKEIPEQAYVAWAAEKRLGFVTLAAAAGVRWSVLPAAARYPLDLYGWSPDGKRVAFRARAAAEDDSTPLFAAVAETGTVAAAGPPDLSIGTRRAGTDAGSESPVFWIGGDRLLVRGAAREAGRPAPARLDWWLVAPGIAAKNLSAAAPAPATALFRSQDGGLAGLQGGTLVALDAQADRFRDVGRIEGGPGEVVLPEDPGRAASALLVVDNAIDGHRALRSVALADARARPLMAVPSKANLFDWDTERGTILWSDPRSDGLFLRESRPADGAPRTLLALDRHLAAIDWGRTLLVDYRGGDGQPLKAAVLLPPDYRPDRRYPVITWVYNGHRVIGTDDYFLDPYMPGLYNLHLYAARGYVVLIPSMPFDRPPAKGDPYLELPKGVLSAVDRLVELGIADPERVGVMGQSYGGYDVYGLVSQTRRFRAAVAIAGLTDLTAIPFGGAARFYPGVEHEMTEQAGIRRLFGLPAEPHADFARAWRNSPLAYVDRVETPLLLVHGEYDLRGTMGEAEAFFYALYQRGRTARLLRYWGETHSLAQSPADIRSVVAETLAWFDRFLAAPPAAPKP